MPKTKIQDYMFAVMMVLPMVYCMTLYNCALENGLTYAVFLISLKTMWVEVAAAFVIQKFIAGPLVKKIVFGVLKVDRDKHLLVILSMAGLTVSIMAPAMTLFVSLFYNGIVAELPLIWLSKLIVNFPFALIIQIFYIGPLVRFLFRNVVKINSWIECKVFA